MYRTIGTRGWAFLAAFSLAMPAVAQIQPIAIPARDFGPVWTGFYVGAAFGAGGAVNKLESNTPALATTFDSGGGSGVLGSIYGGVDYQLTKRGVIGLLAEVSYSGFQGGASAQVPGASANINMNTGLGWAALARAGVGELLQRPDREWLDSRSGLRDHVRTQLVGQARVSLQPVRPHHAGRHQYRPDAVQPRHPRRYQLPLRRAGCRVLRRADAAGADQRQMDRHLWRRRGRRRYGLRQGQCSGGWRFDRLRQRWPRPAGWLL